MLELVLVQMNAGGRAKDGTPVITCSSHLEPSSITELKEKEALDLLLHFSTLSGNSDKNKGVTVIINSTTLPPIAVTTLLQAVGKFQVGTLLDGHTHTHTHTHTM